VLSFTTVTTTSTSSSFFSFRQTLYPGLDIPIKGLKIHLRVLSKREFGPSHKRQDAEKLLFLVEGRQPRSCHAGLKPETMVAINEAVEASAPFEYLLSILLY
jgi:hypothetical protein